MKLSEMLLFALLALCSAAQQDIVKENPQTEEVTFLNPNLEDIIPVIADNGSPLAPLTPAELARSRTRRSSSTKYQGSTLEWQTSYGSIPSGAVSIYNSYTKRTDYVCKYGCSAGFFNPSKGLRCHYPYAEEERLGYPFEILVNKDNFEILEWKDDSWGGVPEHSVTTCLGQDVYVAKNQYGLGKVHARHEAFFLPWEGKEYWYKHYQVLTVNKNVYKERMYNVIYNTNVKVTEHPPQIMVQSTITNKECLPVTKTLSLSKKYQEERRWDTSTAITAGISSSITAKIPFIGSTGITLQTAITVEFSSGQTMTKSTTYTASVKQTVPSNHSCKIHMVGRKYEANIPFTARLRRTYYDRRTTEVSISGTFKGVNMGGIHTIVDRCEPLPNAGPCS
uniref:Uncharacterized protein n=1 Tax=Labrus bergylta TaxID=56723 RepID=A0A3Q3G402_9LABR